MNPIWRSLHHRNRLEFDCAEHSRCRGLSPPESETGGRWRYQPAMLPPSPCCRAQLPSHEALCVSASKCSATRTGSQRETPIKASFSESRLQIERSIAARRFVECNGEASVPSASRRHTDRSRCSFSLSSSDSVGVPSSMRPPKRLRSKLDSRSAIIVNNHGFQAAATELARDTPAI